jgi:hypothetical protein
MLQTFVFRSVDGRIQSPHFRRADKGGAQLERYHPVLFVAHPIQLFVTAPHDVRCHNQYSSRMLFSVGSNQSEMAVGQLRSSQQQEEK